MSTVARHIHQDESGVSFQIDYTIDGDDVLFDSVRVLDEDYRPCGPNMVDFLHSVVTLDDCDPPNGTRYLANIFMELPHDIRE